MNSISSALAFLLSPGMLLVYFTAALFVVGVLTYFTFRDQARIMAGTLNQMREDAKLAGEVFIASHRPKLEVRFAQRNYEDERVGAEFVVINTGTSWCEVIGSRIALIVTEPDRIPNPNDPSWGITDHIPKRRFGINATDRYVVQSDDLPNRLEQHMHDVFRDGRCLYLIGWIVYKDAKEESRTTYFLRQYNLDTRKFDVVKDAGDWESVC